MPSLTILAGPNGAGKTRNTDLLLTAGLLPTFPVDLDLLTNQAIDDLPHSFIGTDARLAKLVDRLFYNYCIDAIQNGKDFCYECNFRKDQLKYVGLFEEAGYELILVYFLLDSIGQSEQRVNYRVKHQNGRFVDLASITENFTQGLANLDNHYQDFNRVLIIDSSQDNYEKTIYPLNIQVDISQTGINCYTRDFPTVNLKAWLPKLAKLVSLNPENSELSFPS